MHLDAFQITRGAGLIVEEVNNISTELVFEALALVEIERAHLIHLDVFLLADDCAQVPLEIERSGADLRHGEGDNVVGHRLSLAENVGEAQMNWTRESPPSRLDPEKDGAPAQCLLCAGPVGVDESGFAFGVDQLYVRRHIVVAGSGEGAFLGIGAVVVFKDQLRR